MTFVVRVKNISKEKEELIRELGREARGPVGHRCTFQTKEDHFIIVTICQKPD